jgi:hypothetical protein
VCCSACLPAQLQLEWTVLSVGVLIVLGLPLAVWLYIQYRHHEVAQRKTSKKAL